MATKSTKAQTVRKYLYLSGFLWLDKPPSNRLFKNRQSKDSNEPFTTGLDGHRRLFPFQSRYRDLLRAESNRQHQRVLPVGTQRAVVARRHVDGRDDLRSRYTTRRDGHGRPERHRRKLALVELCHERHTHRLSLRATVAARGGDD